MVSLQPMDIKLRSAIIVAIVTGLFTIIVALINKQPLKDNISVPKHTYNNSSFSYANGGNSTAVSNSSNVIINESVSTEGNGIAIRTNNGNLNINGRDLSDNSQTVLDTPSFSETQTQLPTKKPELLKEVIRNIRSEPLVLDVFYDPTLSVQWNVEMLDDGTPRYGYAMYICNLLNEHEVVGENTYVRILDAKRIKNGFSFEKSSLGRANCSTFETYPE